MVTKVSLDYREQRLRRRQARVSQGVVALLLNIDKRGVVAYERGGNLPWALTPQHYEDALVEAIRQKQAERR